ncbi:peptide/nickel transport system ATP-binding protein [Labedella gwakjiensis]|uniref:ABC transporter ATP-binding protein n=1 Tax=Labedella gwakjiensis TaxID=390269 RepID=A0A2P8GZB5_9MICO|nr:ABC transporter ATP-binding protein [Labedella gwakjiensis]PSL39295.1 peptide/nickel transport system ATP-binding protein [Labedella gwakjiensis]RUQ86283.1 ABC transporter ATP-binding protein [Labedella gwakjiensis]
MTTPVLSVRDLAIRFSVGGERVDAVHAVDFDLHAGEVLAIVGESGSGKSVTSLAVLGLLPPNATVTGEILVDGTNVVGASEREFSAVRGNTVSMIFQDPSNALDPVFTVGYQIIEMLKRHGRGMSSAERRARAVELLRMVELPDPEDRLGYYPHQLSGGQAQRVMIAMALACDPAVLIADEPTTALDVTVQREILDVLRRLQARTNAAILLITHDMGVVADLADRVVVMRAGRVEETADVRSLFAAPRAEYTRQLLAAVPRIGAEDRMTAALAEERPVLEVEGLVVEYRNRRGRHVRAVDGVSLHIRAGEMLALVGESGSGKSTIGKSVLGLAPVAEGRVVVDGVDLRTASRSAVRTVKKRIGVVFQNPTAALDPRRTIGQSIGEPMRVHLGLKGTELTARVAALLEAVELPATWAGRYPHELSGGQRQRVAIARAVALDPLLLIADEPTSALDVSVQATVLDLLRRLQQQFRFACLFISHDLAVVDALCDRVVVLHRGGIVEEGERRRVLTAPEHDYTRRLLAAAPVPDPDEQARRRGEPLAG